MFRKIYNNELLLSVLIFTLAFLFRIVFITKVPVSLNWDEASFGYNAYSILKTARDEYGEFLPLQFKSVGDYKAPLFIYALIPFIKIFGLNLFTIRLLPALTGSLSVVAFYFLTKFLVNKKTGLIAAIMLVVSPWHLQFTRAGADVGFATFFTILALTSFLYGRNSRYFYYLSLVSFSLSVYSYFAERLFVPMIFVALIFVYKKQIRKLNKRTFMNLLLILVLFILPILLPLISGGHQEKIIKTTIFGFSRSQEYVLHVKSLSASPLSYVLFHSEIIETTLGIADRYLTHFSPRFLFLFGPSQDPRQFISYMGMLYLVDALFVIVGLLSLSKLKAEHKNFIIIWLILSPIPAAITRDPVHARRAFNMVYPLMIFSAMGFWQIVAYLKNKHVFKRFFLSIIFLGTLVFSVTQYIFGYYFFSPEVNFKGPAGWQWGYKELVEEITPIAKNYDQVVVDTTYQGPYIFFLFYQKYSPGTYQLQAELVQENKQTLGEGAKIDNIQFRPIYWPKDRYFSKTLFAGPPERVRLKDIDSQESRILKEIYFPNGEIAWVLVEVF